MSKNLKIILALAVVADIAVWFLICNPLGTDATKLYFLDVGQGDSSLVILPGGAKILIDGGPMNGRLRKNLEEIFPFNDRYIDLVMISHPQLDHFGGLPDVFQSYDIGAVLTTDQSADNKYWKEFEKIMVEKRIPRITLAEGDKILNLDSQFSILSPSSGNNGKDVNDNGIVALLQSNDMKAFFGADIDAKKEKELARKFDLDADVLKVSHHGSRFSSDASFLKEVSPIFAMIEVGKNSYGHPTKEALARFRSFGAQVFRTDLNGFIEVLIEKGKMQVYTQKQSE